MSGAHTSFRVECGDAAEVLTGVPKGAFDCAVTSPPYFGHRDYSGGIKAREIGQECNVSTYVQNLVNVFREVRRTLRDDGTLWLNLGDTYREGRMLGVPWRVAFALQDDNWILRADIIWHKPNAMPSSVKSRPTVDHEYIFLFSKSSEYHYDADAIREPHVTFSEQSKMRGGRNHFGKRNGTPEEGKNAGNSNLHNGRWDQAFHPAGRNKRTVWSIPLGKCREAHFAVFPELLVEPCVKAGSRLGGTVLDPFSGSGTTGRVAKRFGRSFFGIELVEEYSDLARKRIANAEDEAPLFGGDMIQTDKCETGTHLPHTDKQPGI
jgi:site-specific DNA-methyltransferase (adenine-specific)